MKWGKGVGKERGRSGEGEGGGNGREGREARSATVRKEERSDALVVLAP